MEGSRFPLVILATVVLALPLCAQSLVGPNNPEVVHAVQKLEEVIASGRGSKDNTLSCSVDRYPPALGFSFQYQAGYRISLPPWQLRPGETDLLEVTRVASRDTGQPFYFAQRSRPPRWDDVAEMEGGFFVGEGNYYADTIVMDGDGRYCYRHWEFRLRLNDKQREASRPIEPHTVAPLLLTWEDSPDQSRPYRVAVFLKAPPPSRGFPVRVVLQGETPQLVTVRSLVDKTMLVSALRALFDTAPFHLSPIHAISPDEQCELIRLPELNRDTFARLQQAMSDLLGTTVALDEMVDRCGYDDLIAGLVNEELASDSPPDAIVFIGGGVQYPLLKFPPDRIRPFEDVSTRFFYLQFSSPQSRPSRLTDFVETLVKDQGGKVFQISNPEQFAKAIQKMEEILSRDAR